MKKIIYLGLLFSILIDVKAFNVDVDKIEIGQKSSSLVENLDKTYKIDVADFKREEYSNDDVDDLVTDLVKLTLADSDKNVKKKELTNYQYYSSDNGGETLSTTIFIDAYLDKVKELEIEADYIREIRSVTFNTDDILSFVYLGDAHVNKKEESVILIYWFKKSDSQYRLFYPLLTVGHEMDEYFNKVSNNEDNNEIVSGSYKSLALSGSKHEISSEEVKTIYQNNVKSVVQITGMDDNGTSMYGSGFYIRDGIVVTTWSKFLKFLTSSNYIYVNDANGNTHQVLGVVAAEVDYDVVVLKLNESTGQGVNFGDSTKLKLDDILYMINSKNNTGFSISYGSYVTENKGKMRNVLLLNDSDVGSALFDKTGKVVGIAIGDKINSDLSYANSTNYLDKLQKILNMQTFDKIAYTQLETFKQVYYTKIDNEKNYNYVKSDILDKYKKIGNLEKNITLNLVKASYVDKILSLRYKCDTNNMIDTMFLTASYTEQLVLDGYKMTYEDSYKKIYQNNKYKIIIKSNLHYLIILIMEN